MKRITFYIDQETYDRVEKIKSETRLEKSAIYFRAFLIGLPHLEKFYNNEKTKSI